MRFLTVFCLILVFACSSKRTQYNKYEKKVGKRIMKGHQLLALFKDKPEPVQVEVLREGKRKTVSVRAEDVTSRVEKNLTDLQKTACKFEDVKEKSSLCKEKI